MEVEDGARRREAGREKLGKDGAGSGVKILSDPVHIIGLVNIHSFLRYSEG